MSRVLVTGAGTGLGKAIAIELGKAIPSIVSFVKFKNASEVCLQGFFVGD